MGARSAWAAVLLAALVVGAGPAAAGSPSPGEFVERLLARSTQEVRALEGGISPQQGRSLAAAVMADTAHFGLMARWVLGRHWQHASAQQRLRFTEAFGRQIIATAGAVLHRYSDDVRAFARTPSADYDVLRADKRLAEVSLRAEGQRVGEVAVSLRLVSCADSWRVYDARLAGVSLLLTYRAVVAARLLTADLDELIRELERKYGHVALGGAQLTCRA